MPGGQPYQNDRDRFFMLARDAFRESLISHMDAVGITATDLARCTGVSKAVIDKLRQRVTTKVDVIDALALTAFFGKSVEDFLNAPKFSSDMSRLNNAMQRLDNRDLRIISSMLAAMLGNEDGK